MTIASEPAISKVCKQIQKRYPDPIDLNKFITKNKITNLYFNVMNYPEGLAEQAWHLKSLKELLFLKLDSICCLFRNNQISFIPLKGIHLIINYPEYAPFRDIKDLDLLINEDQLPEAIRLLKLAGWETNFPEGGIKNKLEKLINHSATFYETSSGIEFDLHWKLAEGYICSQQFSNYFIQSAANQETTLGYCYPDPEVLILFLAVHCYKNNWQQLQGLVDLKVLVEENLIDHNKLLRLADQFNLSEILEQTAVLGDLFFDLEISTKKITSDELAGFKLITNLAEHREHQNIFKYSKGFNKYKFLTYRYLFPFADDLQNNHNLFFCFIIKYFRLIKNVLISKNE